jgi:hypothetical protein
MKNSNWVGASFAAAVVLSAAPAGATDVGVSVHVSQPGVYGRVDIGRFPQPQLVVAQPVVVRPVTVVQAAQPVYMWVPPGHRKNWRAHCGAYNACGVPVYFVQDQWYEQHVKPHGHGKHKDKHKDKHEDKHNGKHHNKHQDQGHNGKGHGSKGKHGD